MRRFSGLQLRGFFYVLPASLAKFVKPLQTVEGTVDTETPFMIVKLVRGGEFQVTVLAFQIAQD